MSFTINERTIKILKKFFIKTIALLLLLLLCTSCKNKSISLKEIDYSKITFVNLEELYKGMSLKEIKEKWGEPIDSIGSGLNILIYMENKDNMLTLYFDMQDNLNKVKITDRNNTKTIIE